MNRFVACLVVSTLFFACPDPNSGGDGGSDSGVDQDSGQPDVDAGTDAQRCKERWDTLCEAWATCPSSSSYFLALFTSAADCSARAQVGCNKFAAQVPAQGMSGTGKQADDRFEACTAAMARRPICERAQTYVFGTNFKPDPECFAQEGTLTDGTACIIGDQCQSGFCKYVGGCGVCTPLKDVNGSCALSTDCKPGLGCWNQVCAPYLASDAGCSVGDNCGPSETCLGGHCAPKLPDGAACAVNAPNQCARGFCVKGKCEDAPIHTQLGGPCGVDVATGIVSVCGIGGTCQFISQAFQGLCVARAKVGDRCFFAEGFQGGQCETFSQCINGVCSAPGPEPTCGQDGGTPARRDGGVVPSADAGAFASAAGAELTQVCAAAYACPRAQGLRDHLFANVSNCEATFGSLQQDNLSNPFIGLTPAQLQTCVTDRAALGPCEILDSAVFGLPGGPASCAPAPGATAAGTACSNDLQCAAGTHCTVGVLSQACGICAIRQSDGGTCAYPDDCAAGLGCAGGRCIPAGGLSATCSAAAPCDRGLVCRLGTCQKPGDVDAGCNPNNNECLPPLICNRSTSLCELARIVGQDGGALGPDGGVDGATCGNVGGGLLDCPYGYACKITDAVNNRGACETSRNPGETCDWSGGLDGRGRCRFPGTCLNGICTVGDRNYCQ